MTIAHTERENVMELTVADRLSPDEVESVTPHLEAFIAGHKQPRLLITCVDFRGWEPAALLADLKFVAEHRTDFDRIAVVGSQNTIKWLTNIAGFVFSSDVRYFRETEADDARDWVYSDVLAKAGAESMSEMDVDDKLRETFPASDPPAW